MEQWITDMVNQYGGFGIFLLIAIENLFPPIPSEVILTFGGFLTTVTRLTVLEVVWASTCGSMAGAAILYIVGGFFPPEKLKRLLGTKLGRLLRVKPEDLDRTLEEFREKGSKTVFFCRFVPLIRSLISIPAGMAGMRLLPFLGLTLLGSVIWNAVLVLLGAAAGNSWQMIAGWASAYSRLLLCLVAAGCVIFILWKRKK